MYSFKNSTGWIAVAAMGCLLFLGWTTTAMSQNNAEKQPDRVETLIEELKSDDAKIRREAVVALGEVYDSRAIKPLITALKDKRDYVRHAAQDALGNLGQPAVEPLIAALKNE
jgi:HEAT repeat protein